MKGLRSAMFKFHNGDIVEVSRRGKQWGFAYRDGDVDKVVVVGVRPTFDTLMIRIEAENIRAKNRRIRRKLYKRVEE